MKGSYATKLCPKIEHISTLFYQNLSIISPSGRKLLKMKNSKSLTPSSNIDIIVWGGWFSI